MTIGCGLNYCFVLLCVIKSNQIANIFLLVYFSSYHSLYTYLNKTICAPMFFNRLGNKICYYNIIHLLRNFYFNIISNYYYDLNSIFCYLFVLYIQISTQYICKSPTHFIYFIIYLFFKNYVRNSDKWTSHKPR